MNLKLKNENDQCAIYTHSNFGPVFGLTLGAGHDMWVNSSQVHLYGGQSYRPGPFADGSYTIKEMEVFQVTESSPPARIANSNGKQAKRTSKAVKSAQDKIRQV